VLTAAPGAGVSLDQLLETITGVSADDLFVHTVEIDNHEFLSGWLTRTLMLSQYLDFIRSVPIAFIRKSSASKPNSFPDERTIEQPRTSTSRSDENHLEEPMGSAERLTRTTEGSQPRTTTPVRGDYTVNFQSVGFSAVLDSYRVWWPRRLPLPAFDGQDISWAETCRFIGGERGPLSELKLITIEEGSFVISGGYDGIIITKDGVCVADTRRFSIDAPRPDLNGALPAQGLYEIEIPTAPARQEFDEVFVGFDGAWSNYFHWLCFAVAKSYIAARILPRTCAIVLPDYRAHANDSDALSRRRLTYSENVWHQSLDLAGLTNRVVPLPAGIYKARRVHIISDGVILSDLFYRAFYEMRTNLSRPRQTSRRVFISRTGVELRMGLDEHQALETTLARLGFSVVELETLSFIEQTELFYNAEIVVGAHGAGLANLLFGSDQLRVLELNRELDAGRGLRPWFYLMAAHRNFRYSFLDGSIEGFPTRRVTEAVQRLLG
jgi:hypothetical protein